MSLYRAETRRLVKRRFTRWFVLGTLLVLVAVAVGTLLTNQKLGPEQFAQAKAAARQDFEQSRAGAERMIKDCEAARGTPEAQRYPANCEGLSAPTEDSFRPEWYLPATFTFKDKFPDMVTALAGLLALVGFVIGASFVGAEWSSGGMMNLLLWRPQRLRVLTTKLAAFLVGLVGLAVVLSALWTGIFLLIAQARGSTAAILQAARLTVAMITQLKTRPR